MTVAVEIPCALGQRIHHFASAYPERIAFVVHRRHDDAGEALTWGDLWRRARAVRHGFPTARQDRPVGVLIFCDDELNFVVALVATWLAGAVAIPATGRLMGHLQGRNQHIIARSQPDLIVHDLPASAVQTLEALAPAADLLCVSDVPALDPGSPDDPKPVARMLQFTSGSTLHPKPVLMDSSTIAAGCQAIEHTFGLSSASVGVSWLPLYHDMGLVGHVLMPLWTGGISVILRPAIFIQRPLAWLKMLSVWRATITSAPNFAFERLCRSIETGTLGAVDLSHLQTVVMGGEPVLQTTVNALLQALEPHGLRPDALAPAYGLAEVTLLASSGQRPGGPVFDSHRQGIAVANLGPAVSGLTATVREAETGARCADGEIGELWFEGPAVGRVIAPDEDWRNVGTDSMVRTGDSGYFIDGDIHLVGRVQGKMILRGQNVYAEDVETLVLNSQSDGFSTGVVAFGVPEGGTETLCVLIEQRRRTDSLDRAALNQQIVSILGVKPTAVVVLRKFTFPRTTSGKIQRNLARDAFLSGQFEPYVLSRG